MATERSHIFIGSSSEAMKVPEAIRESLLRKATSCPGLKPAGQDLSRRAGAPSRAIRFAVLVWAPDDITASRGKELFLPGTTWC